MADVKSTPAIPSAGGMSTTTMALIAIAVLVFGAFLYTKMSTPAPGAATPPVAPKMGSGADSTTTDSSAACKSSDIIDCAAVAKRKSGNFKPYQGAISNVGAFYSTGGSLFGNPDGKNTNTNLAWGFLIGLNVDATASNLQIFKQYIQEYIDNPAHLMNYEVTAGQFLG